jgi:hypothetical protein
VPSPQFNQPFLAYVRCGAAGISAGFFPDLSTTVNEGTAILTALIIHRPRASIIKSKSPPTAHTQGRTRDNHPELDGAGGGDAR